MKIYINYAHTHIYMAFTAPLDYKSTSPVSKNERTAIVDYFRFYTHDLKIGIIASITGGSHLKSGVGKSYAARRIGERMDRDYMNGTTAMEKIVFAPKDYLKAMTLLEDKRGIMGQVIVIDEAGILVNAKKWFTFFNKAMTDTVVTFRELRGLAIFVTPSLRNLDKDIRYFVTHTGVCYKHMAGKPLVLMSLYRNYWAEDTGKLYKYRIRMRWSDYGNRKVELSHFKVLLCKNQELTEAYEAKMVKYKAKVRRGIQELDKIEKTMTELVKDILANPDMITSNAKTGEPHVYTENILAEYNVTHHKARMLARRANEELKKKEKKEP